MKTEITDLTHYRLVRLTAEDTEEANRLQDTQAMIQANSSVIPIYRADSRTLTIAIKNEKDPTETLGSAKEIPCC